ncbi:putative uncharacterized transposon-derived protein [Collichthys lucidus]|uniref:Uncharacterized transposon-derived protein n=1 Tax=Collichthys lucidus TaxID=240159 RepID=A0A4U5TVW2_COLLU|nr:putative uncharacterized transposon-derived protein [Collichthys lucidus]
MFKHKGVHMCTWHQDALGRSSMIDFVVVSSDLRPHVLDTRVKRGAELSTDHHLVKEFQLPPPGELRSCPGGVGDIESKWTLFPSSIVDAVAVRWSVPVVAAAPNPLVDTGVAEAKTRSWEEFGEAMESDFRTASRRFWTTIRRLRRGKQCTINTVFIGDGVLLTSTGDVLGGRVRREFLKALDVLVDTSLQHRVDIAGSASGLADRGGGCPLQKGDRRMRSNYRGITLLSLPRKVFSGVLERRVRKIVEPRIQEEQCGFRPGHGTVDQLYTLGGSCGGSPGVWGSGPIDMGYLVPVLSVPELGPHCRHPVGFIGERDLQLSLERFAAECEGAGMRIISQRRVECSLRVGDEILPQVEEFKYLGVLFTSEGRMEREIDWQIGAASAVMQTLHRSVAVKKELSRKAKLSIYQSIYVPTLIYGDELWVVIERMRSRIQAAEMSFLRRVAGVSLRDRVRSSAIREELRVELLLLRMERNQLRWLRHLVRMPPGSLLGEMYWARPSGRQPRGRPRTRWRDYVSQLAWERLGVPLG